MARPHVLVIPGPAQGHVMPLMELSRKLVDSGCKVTFVNTEFNHKRILSALSKNENTGDPICLVSIPDGLESVEDRNHPGKLIDATVNVMPGYLEQLIQKMNESNNGDDRITCLLADLCLGWILKVADKFSIKRAAFWPASGQLLAESLHLPKLIEDGVVSKDGTLMKTKMIQLSPSMPAINPSHFSWLCTNDLETQKSLFNVALSGSKTIQLADYLMCNSFYELETPTFNMIPNLKPIGPLCGSSHLAQFWHEDQTCLSWLDQQESKSVIYVAFGSFTVMDKRQFHELALGLELSGRPFLWVVRPNLISEATDKYPDGFEARTQSQGRMVGWAPQREVLAHPSIACFVSHCGWNSTMEGLSQGIPFLCWPYGSDQFGNKSYVCDIWKVGLSFTSDENGIINREEIKVKVLGLLEDKEIKERSLYLKEIAMKNVSNGGASSKNFEDFVNWITN